MPPDQPEKRPGPSKRKRRSSSVHPTPSMGTLDVTQPSELGISSSCKHGRQEEGSQLEGSPRRKKPNRASEPPTRKDTSMAPNAKRKRLDKNVNYHQATQTGEHQEFRESPETFESGLAKFRQEINNTKRGIQAKLDWQVDQEGTSEEQDRNVDVNAAELKRLQKLCNEQSEELRKAQSIIDSDHKELESLRDMVNNPFTGIPAFRGSCDRKNAELKVKDEDIAVKQQELDNKTHVIDCLRKSLETANNAVTSGKEKLANTTRKVTEAKERHEKLEQEAEALRKVNDTNGAWNKSLEKQAFRAKDTLAKERADHKKTTSKWEAEQCDLQGRYKELKKGYHNQKNWYNEKIASLQLQLQDSRPQSQRFNFKVPDEKVKQDFAALDSKIRQFVDKYTRPVHNLTDQELQTYWPGWSPELRKFLASPLLCNLVFEGYMWECLLGRIFTPWSRVWTGDMGLSLEKALCISGEVAESKGIGSELYTYYQYWRSSSSSFIGHIVGDEFRPEYFDSDVKAMTLTLEVLCGIPENTLAMKTEATSIFEDARDFEIQLRKLKAVYSFRMCQPVPTREKLTFGMYLDEDEMIERSPCPNHNRHGQVPVVDFIMSPGLHKRGNNDGDKYEDDTCLVKMGVVCDAARFLQKTDASIPAQPIPMPTPKELGSGEAKQEDEGQHIVSQSHTPSKADKANDGSSISNPVHIQDEETSSQNCLEDPSSTASIISGSSAPDLRHAPQMQQRMTRSQTLSNADRNVHDEKPSTKPGTNRHPPMGPATR